MLCLRTVTASTYVVVCQDMPCQSCTATCSLRFVPIQHLSLIHQIWQYIFTNCSRSFKIFVNPNSLETTFDPEKIVFQLCQSCNPPREYLRLFDVTERTGVRKHQTGRFCTHCKQELRDSIVHFGERSPGLSSPYNWEEAAQAADQADLVLCIGSSLKVCIVTKWHP